ncbi:anti-sigma-K factor RskA [Pantoea sp. PNA 14-12]|uniref:anti-sigma factor n=1 Tax=Pantoea TaxID=53335 RepID=UPI00050E62E7|nr:MULTISPECIES: anti-sigma factor [Pantoea]KGD81074.1 hypothetical protein HA47_19190 [Pantoea stewartii subsp. indologenes]TDS72433.1 anti-sigma-K factor RskA [Pantoea sp. PNA 14-12]
MNRQQRDDALSAEYAIGTLRGPARLRFQTRLLTEPELAEQVAKWQTLLAGLDSQLIPEIPPDRVWKKIVLNLPAKPSACPARRAALGWMVAAAIAVLALFSWRMFYVPEFTPLTVMSDAQQHSQWVVSADHDLTQLRVTPLQPVTADSHTSLQLWLIPTGSRPISLGLLNAEQATQLALKRQDSLKNAVVAISREPRGGSPTGQPTGPVLYSGKI